MWLAAGARKGLEGRRRAGSANDGHEALRLGGGCDFAAEEKAKQVEEEPERGEEGGQGSAAGTGQHEGDHENRDDA